ncbi:MerR family transcriptional regulator [Paractinoplanes brasiliensis]|uniref:DNA-binding transcriptional MerR regulator n=1 Tax=Paractinoplanes brasiliensis TaxID=52695 RepID=A0A4R6K1G7_9ACTN|nr:MerR family transcriptional regulator [Actinoplanes brasiliensis]TDO42132.1 DNA-binding transcriptional MerR regulator [Actinoplanes brasiliensis]GID32004.1 MerR family transcriptional regulator [Actinoplanes brasiliensis]
MLIGEVARRSGVSTRMLRHYDRLGLVRPTGRTVGNYREYSDADIRRIFHVESLRSLGLSLKQIAQALEDPGFTPAALVGDLIRWTEERLEREQELLQRLRAVDATRPEGWPDVLRIVELMHGLASPDAARRQQAVLAPADDVPVPVDLLAGAVLSESDPNVAGALRWALARAGDDALSGVAPGITSGDVDVRRRAVSAIANIPGDEATAVLADALGDGDPTVRGNAALALAARGVTAAEPELVAMVVTGLKDVDATEALGVLARDHGRAAHIVLALAAELNADAPVRIRLAQALYEIPGGEAVLERLAQDEDRAVALIATAFLSTRDQP